MSVKNHINIPEILDDIRSGTDDQALMEKYHLSREQLRAVFEELSESVSPKDFYSPESFTTLPPSQDFKCSVCGTPRSSELEVCPKCGVFVPKTWTEQLKNQKNDQHPRTAKRKTLLKVVIGAGLALIIALIIGQMLTAPSLKKQYHTRDSANSEVKSHARVRVDYCTIALDYVNEAISTIDAFQGAERAWRLGGLKGEYYPKLINAPYMIRYKSGVCITMYEEYRSYESPHLAAEEIFYSSFVQDLAELKALCGR